MTARPRARRERPSSRPCREIRCSPAPPCPHHPAAAVQSLWVRRDLRPACRQQRARQPRHRSADPLRPIGDALPQRTGRLRRRRVDGGGHLRRPPGQAGGRRHDPLSVLEPAPGLAHHPRRAGRRLLLDPEPGARGRTAQPAAGHGRGDPDARRAGRPGRPGDRRPDRRLSQPPAHVGGAAERVGPEGASDAPRRPARPLGPVAQAAAALLRAGAKRADANPASSG